MKKLKKLNWEELGNAFAALKPFETNLLIGGTTFDEYVNACNAGTWQGGYVDGFGYATGVVTCYGGALGAMYNAINELGVAEVAGSSNNPRISEYFVGCNGYGSSTPDSTPWCSAFVNFVVEKAGLQGTGSAVASSWSSWGVSTTSPHSGDIAISSAGDHVGVVKSVDSNGVVTIISGNYSNSVMESVATGYSFRTAN